MGFLFILTCCYKLLIMLAFSIMNANDKGSPGWAFQHMLFIFIVLFTLLPLAFFERSMLLSRDVLNTLSYAPFWLLLLNFIPILLGNWSTKAFVVAQIIGVIVSIGEMVFYYHPDIGK